MRNCKEEHYTFHKGDLVCFYINGKKTLGRVTGYVFYGADKFCQSPAYLVTYKTRILRINKTVLRYEFDLEAVK